MTSAAYSSQSAPEKEAGDVQYCLPVAAMPPSSAPRPVTFLIAGSDGNERCCTGAGGQAMCRLELASEQKWADAMRLSADPFSDAFLIVF